MKTKLPALLLAALILTACASRDANRPAPTQPSADTPTQPVATAPQASQGLETEPQSAVTLPQVAQGSISDAPGTVSFYVGDSAVYCGQKVADLLALPVIVEGDISEVVQPGDYSCGIRLRMADENQKFEDNIYFIAVNPDTQPRELKDCLVYSLTFNCETGLRFGFGGESFVTGQTTEGELTAAWGAPAHRYEGKDFQQLVYFRPFSFLQVVVRQHGVDQVTAYHSAYLYPDLAGQNPPGDYLGSDAMLLLSRHMDIAPYLGGGKGQKRELPLEMTIAGETIHLGDSFRKLPEPWYSVYEKTRIEVMASRYVTIQRPRQEGFIFLNRSGDVTQSMSAMSIKGILAFNPNYTSWYYDYTGLRGFDYQGVTHESTIEQLVEKLGLPYEIVPANGPNCCFAWLHYEAQNKDTLRFKVDPASNQIIEVRLEDYVAGTYQ